MQPSDKQKTIIDTWSNTDKNILVDSVAGSGKTTLLTMLLKEVKEPTLVLSFNKGIEREFSEKIESQNLNHSRARTMHSLGFESIRYNADKFQVKSGKSKNFEIVEKVQQDFPSYFDDLKWSKKMAITYTLFNMNDTSRMFMTNDLDEVVEKMEIRGKSVAAIESKYLKPMWHSLLKHRNKTYEGKIDIDFIDMIWLPIVKGWDIPFTEQNLMIDEAQDLAFYQHKFIDRMIEQGINKWVAVGDKRQSIYGFAGAYNGSFDLFKHKENVVELPLNICYRCSKEVIKDANKVYDVIQPFKDLEGKVYVEEDIDNIKSGSMVICRTSSPLIELYFKLLSLNKNAHLKGSDILNETLNFIKNYKYDRITQAQSKMKNKLDSIKEKLKRRHTKSRAIEHSILKQNFKNFKLLTDNLSKPHDKVGSLFSKIKQCFKGDDEDIILSTIHKAKGLEADYVYILNESLIPHELASSNEELAQEENLRYVARTRAKKETIYI